MPRRLLNHHEQLTHEELQRASKRWGLSVSHKVRVADVLNLDRLDIDWAHYGYGLKSHFDFVVCRDDWIPEYAVEFDGPQHASVIQSDRDRKKDLLCKLDDFPILRINARYLTRNFGKMTLLAWVMDAYELDRGFFQAQVDGIIPKDEMFSPFFVAGLEPGGDRFPYQLARRARARLQMWHEKGMVREHGSSGVRFRDQNEALRGIEFIGMSDDTGVYVTSAMRDQQFPVYMGDLFDEILTVQLTEKVAACLEGKEKPVLMAKVDAEIASMKARFRVAGAHSVSPPCKQGAGGSDCVVPRMPLPW